MPVKTFYAFIYREGNLYNPHIQSHLPRNTVVHLFFSCLNCDRLLSVFTKKAWKAQQLVSFKFNQLVFQIEITLVHFYKNLKLQGFTNFCLQKYVTFLLKDILRALSALLDKSDLFVKKKMLAHSLRYHSSPSSVFSHNNNKSMLCTLKLYDIMNINKYGWLSNNYLIICGFVHVFTIYLEIKIHNLLRIERKLLCVV